jgi:hypothetical protein
MVCFFVNNALQAYEDNVSFEENIGQYLTSESITIINEGVLSRTKIEKNTITQITLDLLTGKLNYVKKIDNNITEKEIWIKPINFNQNKLPQEYRTIIFVRSNQTIEKGCGAYIAAIDSAMDFVEYAISTNNAQLIDAAQNTLDEAVLGFRDCVVHQQ